MNDIQSVKHDSVLSHPSRAKRPLDRVIIFCGGLQRRQSGDGIDGRKDVPLHDEAMNVARESDEWIAPL